MDLEFRPLNADEIDCRIAQINAYYVTLLLYKDARVDMNMLDEKVGAMNWKREHTRDNANCIVSIWDEKKQQWISKEDTGKESYTEAEKGLASDSFKRACVNWGIGRELYTSPKISFPAKMANVKDGKCYDKFYVERIVYDENRNIKELSIINNNTGVRVFDTTVELNNVENLGSKPISEEYAPSSDEDCAEPCSTKQINYLKKLMGNEESMYLSMYGVDSITKLTKAQASSIINKLK